MKTNLKILWVDDDGETDFPFESYKIKLSYGEITWGKTLIDAAEKLTQNQYDCLILDQMLYGCGEYVKNAVWAGCRLLFWLRGMVFQESRVEIPEPWRKLDGLCPLEQNQNIPAIICSAYYDKYVVEQTQKASTADATLEFVSKPIRFDLLMNFLQCVQMGEK